MNLLYIGTDVAINKEDVAEVTIENYHSTLFADFEHETHIERALNVTTKLGFKYEVMRTKVVTADDPILEPISDIYKKYRQITEWLTSHDKCISLRV